MIKEIIKGEHKWIIRLGRKGYNGEQLYDYDFYEYYPSIKQWRLISTERDYTAEAIALTFGISI